MNRNVFTVTILLIMLMNLPGCASNLTGSSYSREEARTPQKVQIGTVEFVRPVVIEGTKTPIVPAQVRLSEALPVAVLVMGKEHKSPQYLALLSEEL